MTYWSASVGPYTWHEFEAERVGADLRSISLLGHHIVRTMLTWDAFMPQPATVDTSRLRDLERFLTLAEAQSLRVVPVLFAQSVGDCVMLPPFAIDVSRPRRGVRAVTDGVVQPGGPRDLYVDPLMIEAQLRLLERLLSAFAGHPAIAWWDLGHDPATTIRPRRLTHLQGWAEQMAQPLRDRRERSALTLGAADVVTARGVRLGAVARAVDVLGLAVDAQDIPLHEPRLSVAPTLFLVQLAQRLSGVGALQAHVGVCERGDQEPPPDAGCDDPADTARFAADAVPALSDAGCSAILALQWSCAGDRALASPPFDFLSRLARRGVVDAAGAPTRLGEAWSAALRGERDAQPAAPWPTDIDIDDYYAHLPESVHDLYDEWKRERQHDPAMLS